MSSVPLISEISKIECQTGNESVNVDNDVDIKVKYGLEPKEEIMEQPSETKVEIVKEGLKPKEETQNIKSLKVKKEGALVVNSKLSGEGMEIVDLTSKSEDDNVGIKCEKETSIKEETRIQKDVKVEITGTPPANDEMLKMKTEETEKKKDKKSKKERKKEKKKRKKEKKARKEAKKAAKKRKREQQALASTQDSVNIKTEEENQSTKRKWEQQEQEDGQDCKRIKSDEDMKVRVNVKKEAPVLRPVPADEDAHFQASFFRYNCPSNRNFSEFRNVEPKYQLEESNVDEMTPWKIRRCIGPILDYVKEQNAKGIDLDTPYEGQEIVKAPKPPKILWLEKRGRGRGRGQGPGRGRGRGRGCVRGMRGKGRGGRGSRQNASTNNTFDSLLASFAVKKDKKDEIDYF